MYVVVTVATFDTERHAVDRGILGTGDAHDLAVAHVQVEIAAHAAVGAGGPHFADLVGPPQSHTHLVV